MDKISEEVIAQTEGEITSPLSPKRPRTDCMTTNHVSRKGRFEFPELLTFGKHEGPPSSLSGFQNMDPVCTAEYQCGDIPCEEYQHKDAVLNGTPVTEVATSHNDDSAVTGLSNVCFITAERHFLHLGKVEQPLVIETDKLSSCPGDAAEGVLPESHTSNDTRADTSAWHDCEPLGKSLEPKPPGGGSLPFGNDEYRQRGQNDSHQIHAIDCILSEPGKVICQPDCVYEDAPHDAGFYNTSSQSAEVEESNHKAEELSFCENILLNKEEEAAKSHISPSDYRSSNSPNSNTDASSSGSLAEAEKNAEKRGQSDVKENAAVCDGETKEKVCEKGMSNNGNPTAAECAAGSIVLFDVILATNIIGAGTEASMNREIDDYCGAKGGNAAGKMIAEARSEAADHTTKTPVPARISQEPIEGDNDAGPVSAIDPAILSQSDREFEGKCCNSESTAGVELSPSVAVSMVQTPLADIKPEHNTKELSASDQTVHFNSNIKTQQYKGEKEDTCQSYTEVQPYSITTNETHDMNDNEGTCHWKCSPSSSLCRPVKPVPAGDRGKESPGVMGHLWKEQDQAGCSPINIDHPKTHEVAYSQTQFAMMDGTAGGKGNEQPNQQHNQQYKTDNITEISTGDCVSDWTRSEISKCDNKSTLPIEDGQENLLGCFTDCKAETFMLDNKDELLPSFTSLPPSDAVVPGLQDLSQSPCSENADNLTAQHCNDRFPPVPSAFVLPDRVPEGFDTFEKIQLSPDDDTDDLGHSPLLTSLPEQLLKASQRQPHHSMPGAESDDHKVIKEEEEEVGKIECPAENMGCEVPSFISTTHIHTVEEECSSQGAPDFYDHYQADLNPHFMHSSVQCCPEFEMKEQYNMVLEELSMYFEISTNDFPDGRVSSPQQHGVTTEAQSGNASDCRQILSSPAVESHKHILSDDEDDVERSLEVCGSDPVDPCTTGCDHEQEVPLNCTHPCQKAAVCSLGEDRESRELEQKIWAPSFIFPSFVEQLSNGLPEPPRRLEPLRTCTRPIRVGLSKRAKTKHLHCPHPYK